jgi:hypothetical protein
MVYAELLVTFVRCERAKLLWPVHGLRSQAGVRLATNQLAFVRARTAVSAAVIAAKLRCEHSTRADHVIVCAHLGVHAQHILSIQCCVMLLLHSGRTRSPVLIDGALFCICDR